MTNVDLFDELTPEAGHEGSGAPIQAEMAIPPAGTVTRHRRPAAVPGGADDPHYRLAMRAARRLPRTDRRDQTRRLICHHLRCMLEEPAPAHGARR